VGNTLGKSVSRTLLGPRPFARPLRPLRLFAGGPFVLGYHSLVVKAFSWFPGVLCGCEPLPSYVIFPSNALVFVSVSQDGLHFLELSALALYIDWSRRFFAGVSSGVVGLED
jgi:hypothetical protein